MTSCWSKYRLVWQTIIIILVTIKFIIIFGRIWHPRTTIPLDSQKINITIPKLDLPWLHKDFQQDVQQAVDVRNKYFNEDFRDLMKKLDKEAVYEQSFQPNPDYIGTKLENLTNSIMVPSQDLDPLNNLAQFNISTLSKDAASTSNGTDSPNLPWLKLLPSFDNSVSSSNQQHSNTPVSSISNTIKSENPLHSKDTAQSNPLVQTKNSTWLFYKLLPASQNAV